MEKMKFSRRHFLGVSAGAVAGTVLAACAPKEIVKTVEVEKEVTKEVEKVVEVTSAPQAVNSDLVPAPVYKFDGGPSWQAPDLTGKSMTLWGLQYDPHVERYKELAKLFTQHTGATVDLQPQEWPIDEKIMAAMAAGTPPDVVCWMGVQSVPLIKQKALVDLGDLVFKPIGLDVEKWFRPGAIGAYNQDGKYWGVPVEDNGDGYSVSARIDLIRDLDESAQTIWKNAQDKTWFSSYEEMWSLAEALQTKSGKDNLMGMSSQGWNQHSLLSIMRSLGTFWWDQENEKFNMDSDACVQALDLLVTTPFQRGIEAVAGDNLVNTFVAGKTGLARGNFSAAGEAQKVGFSAENVVAPSPVEGKDPLFVGEGGWGFEMPVGAANQAVGIEFLKFVSTFEAQHTFSQIYGGGMPSCNAVAESDIYQGDDPFRRGLRRCVKALENCVFFGYGYGSQSDVGTVIDEAFTSLREGKLTSKEAAKQMQAGMETQLKNFKAE
jgi:ABC-type glycerol-3-phosphate transport system substrate-binding protein